MSRTVYALLVGIDNYAGSVRPLKGCVNDVRRTETLLRERIIGKHIFSVDSRSAGQLDRDQLTDEVRNEFQNQDKPLTSAAKVLIHESGREWEINDADTRYLIRNETQTLKVYIGKNDRFDPCVLINEQATRKAVIDGFRTHLCKAGPNDVALFYYSGHGSQEQAPPEFWHLEPDRLDETLVCYDSRSQGGWDLADKELAQLIFEVAAKRPHIAIILDACHSGTITRAPEEEDNSSRVRLTPADTRLRPLETFIVSPEVVKALDRRSEDGVPSAETKPFASDWFNLPIGQHLVLAACRAEEEAKETQFNGEQRGVFSYYLLDTLQRTGESLTYRDLFKRVAAMVRTKAANQSPQIEATLVSDLNQPFLGGALVAGTPYYTLSYDKKRGWIMDGGAVHGIPSVTGNETTVLALFPFATPASNLRDREAAIGVAHVQETFPAQSMVNLALDGDKQPDPESTYKAVITSLPLPPLLVVFEGENSKALERVRTAIANAGIGGEPSLLVREGERANAELSLIATNHGFRIRRIADAYPLVVDIHGVEADEAEQAVAYLEHIARWMKIAELANPNSLLPPDAVRMEFYSVDAITGKVSDNPFEPAERRLEYQYHGDKWVSAKFKIKLINTTARDLYCTLLDLREDFAVDVGLLPGGKLHLTPAGTPAAEVWAFNDQPIPAYIRKQLWQQGIVKMQDLVKLIVSTDEVEGILFEQGGLDVASVRDATKGVNKPYQRNTLNRLMRRVSTRDVGADPEEEDALVDWRTSEVALTIVRPLEATPVPSEQGSIASLGAGVRVMAHPSLNAKARLTTVSEASRAAGNLALPPLLRNNPNVMPLEFSTSRSGEPGLSVLELVDVENYEVVTPDAPLHIKTETLLSQNEYILPVGYDGEFYLPLGHAVRRAGGAEIRLDRLPAPLSGEVKGLGKSLKIFFQKVVSQHLGTDYNYPQLAAVTVDDQGKVSSIYDIALIKAKVAAAKRILLYIHGIIGETQAMAASAQTAWLNLAQPVPPLADRYDLILTFDYESINTTIERTARDFKQKLAEVGLDLNRGKILDIVAHSMGGLVARWFIEYEGGNKVVKHLVMVGTPNAGSPWPTIQDWATAAIAIGLNGLAAVAWPVKALGALVSAVEKFDHPLDEMRQDSNFMESLASSTDPDVQYTVIVGDTAILPTAIQVQGDEKASRFERLWARIKPQKWLYEVSDLAFFGRPNDIAVDVAGSQKLPTGWKTKVKAQAPVACDHITYFSSVPGLQALAENLG